jgi:hypothetical protein
MIPCRTDRSILKVIVMLFGPVSHAVAALLPSRLSIDEDATRRPHAKHWNERLRGEIE